ncbi:MotA/TolQ/ExbB proton channel family protein [Peredibacter starrii]|uniref:MotA/TolQ/ExbB proton channel family protein n=1 Tax=Peredibacter starrii TaxID=28202 RepID=A0AAX4HMS4_9BACT|nr:MotA/TolQ/ExbB proton channel family protein [Peredibacter starrii]WPU64570.1 MotA/TolQ/ExbB proton channel family protein [Peredibacter starrii]
MKNLRNLTLASGIALLITAICMTLLAITNKENSPTLYRILVLLGGDVVNGGYIQGLTYLAFVWAWFEVREKLTVIARERRAFKLNLIPTSEKHVFMPQDVNQLKFKLIEFERKEKYILSDLLKKACTKFRTSGSLSELIDIVSIQIEVSQEKAEGDQSVIRYLTWVIPSLGFIGTVIGISQSLVYANSGDMEKITSLLGVAFDTTLVALVLSVFLMWFVHQLQEETDRFHSDLKEFVIDNLINKIEIQ